MSYSKKIYKGKLYRSNHDTAFEDDVIVPDDNAKRTFITNRFSSGAKQEDNDYIYDYEDEVENLINEEKYN